MDIETELTVRVGGTTVWTGKEAGISVSSSIGSLIRLQREASGYLMRIAAASMSAEDLLAGTKAMTRTESERG